MMDFQGLSAMQYRLLRESFSEGFKQLRQENAKNAQVIARAIQDNAKNAQVIAKAVQDNAQRFARLEELIRNLQPPQGGVGGSSSESSDEKPGSRR